MSLAKVQAYDRPTEVAHIIAAAIIRMRFSQNLGKSRVLEQVSLDFSAKGSVAREGLLEKTNYGQDNDTKYGASQRVCY